MNQGDVLLAGLPGRGVHDHMAGSQKIPASPVTVIATPVFDDFTDGG